MESVEVLVNKVINVRFVDMRHFLWLGMQLSASALRLQTAR